MMGTKPRAAELPADPSIADVVIPHPVYAAQGWVAVVNPGAATSDIAVDLLRQAHEDARARAKRHAQSAQP